MSALPLAAAAHAQDRKPIPVPENLTTMTFDAIRDVEWCEVKMLVPNAEKGVDVHYFQSTGLRGVCAAKYRGYVTETRSEDRVHLRDTGERKY